MISNKELTGVIQEQLLIFLIFPHHLFTSFMIGPSIQDHESPVDLFEDQDPRHQVGKGQVRQFPPQIRPFFQGGSGWNM